ncbi:MAG: hypothetical protein HYX27_09735 [Acidobacteria bacterium]|nr:hypothetical protein [Acidobacteriota bacterium]
MHRRALLAAGLTAWAQPRFIELANDTKRQVIVDREPGQYLGHPTTVLLEDGRTILCVHPKGHGKGAIQYKHSTDAALAEDHDATTYTGPDRLFITFRDTGPAGATKGDWVAWTGTYGDIVHNRPGRSRVWLMRNHKGADCAYPGLERLPNGTIVTTTYGHWTPNEEPYIVAVRIRPEEL